jgi:hypothetical protein
MRSIIAEDAPSALPIPIMGPHQRLDRLNAATSTQMKTALIFLSAFSSSPKACNRSNTAITHAGGGPPES